VNQSKQQQLKKRILDSGMLEKDKKYVKHLNSDTHDNRVENLEWTKRNSGKAGRPRKNSEGITISTGTFTTGTIDLSDRYSSVSTHDEPVMVSDYIVFNIPFTNKWQISKKDGEYLGIFDSKEEAEMAVPDEVYQNECF
jgi:hypothetical protein